jgi:hypothetical protein
MIRKPLPTFLLCAGLTFFTPPAFAQEPADPGAKHTQKNTDGTTTTTEPYGNGGAKKITENAKGDIVDVVTEQPDGTYGDGGTKVTIAFGKHASTIDEYNEPTTWLYKDRFGKIRRIEHNQDINGEDWIGFALEYGADGRLKSYTREVHTGNPEEFSEEGLKTVFNFDPLGRPSTVLHDLWDEQNGVTQLRIGYRYAGADDKKGTRSAEVYNESTKKWEPRTSNVPEPVNTASIKADEVLKVIRGATERQISIVEDLDLGMFQYSIDKADAETAGTPTPSAGTQAAIPGYGTSIPPPGAGVPPWEIPPGSPWETPASNPWQFPPGGFPREIPPMKK